MNPGSVFFDKSFAFHDGESGEKLFVVLGTVDLISVVAKTTSKQAGKGVQFGCQPKDRFHNFFIPPGTCYLKKATWVCLNEFYELKSKAVLQKSFNGQIGPVCVIDNSIMRQIQDCALESMDISKFQASIISACLVEVNSPSANTPSAGATLEH